MSRIELTDSMIDIATKMSDGNPGALTTIMELVKNGEEIDPMAFGGGMGTVLLLDTLGIYGTDIYVLWSDICGRNIAGTIAVVRAFQLGFLDKETLVDACSRQDYSGRDMIDVDAYYKQVKENLSNFDPNNVYES